MPESLLEHSCQQYLESYGVNFGEWRLGGSYGEVPTAAALMFLSWCINEIESEEAQLLLMWYKHAKSLSKDVKHAPRLFHYLYGRRESDNPPFNEFLASGKLPAKAHKKTHIAFMSLKASLEDVTGSPVEELPWKYQEDISKSARRIYCACLGILFMLTGARISEIHSIKASWFKKDIHGVWHFRSEILNLVDMFLGSFN